MLQVGIFNGYFPYPLAEQASRIRALGFNTVQLDFNIKGMDFAAPEDVTQAKARLIRETFRDHDLPICCLAVPINLVHPNAAKRRELLALLTAFLRHARAFGSPYVVSETGTYNPHSDWAPHPHNKTEAAFADCRDVISKLAQVAYDHGATFVVETYVNNVIGSVAETVRLFAEVDHPGLGLLMDPTNYFESHNIDRMDAVLKQIFDTLSDKILIAHAKDVKRAGADKSEKHAAIDAAEGHTFRGVGEIELPAPGLGVLNYDYYLRRLAEKHPNVPIIIEHLDESDVPRAKRFLDGRLRALGV